MGWCCVEIRTKPPGRVHRTGPRGPSPRLTSQEDEHVKRHLLILLAGVVALAAFAGCSQQPTSPRTATALSGLPAGGSGGSTDTTGGPPPPPPPPPRKTVEVQAYFTDSASVAGAVVHLHIIAQSFAQDTTGIT